MLVSPAKPTAVRLLLIVSRTEPALYRHLKYVFDCETGDVILDRRLRERRLRPESMTVEKRRGDRRLRDITDELLTYGWALVRY